jgi:hypothetical protein
MSEDQKKLMDEAAKIQIQKMDKISLELKPFLDRIRAIDRQSANLKLFKEAYACFKGRLEVSRKIHYFLIGGYNELIRVPAQGVLASIYEIFAYLGIIESEGNSVADMIVMLLVTNGRAFRIEREYGSSGIKYAHSIVDLEKVPLGTKLRFMETNGIIELSSAIDSKLRNAIAHMEIQVKECEIFIEGKPASWVMAESTGDLMLALTHTEDLLEKLADDIEATEGSG